MNITGFQILEQLGEGPMSTVWKAQQVSLNRVVAIKVLKQKFTIKPGEVHPVLKEARQAAGLKQANIVQIYDAGEIDSTFYFVMEYVAGSTVTNLIKEKGQISLKSTMNAALLVAEALHHAWTTANLVHRAINPDNVLLDTDGTVKVADLGQAKPTDPSYLSAQLKAGTIQGKLNYTSPEQAKCSIRIDCRTDMYGLGATLYHMLTGRVPFQGLEPKEVLNQQLTGFLENPRDIHKNIPKPVADLLTRLMMKDYKARPKDWAEVLEDIRRIQKGKLSVTQRIVPPVEGAEQAASTIAAAKTAPPPSVRRSLISRHGAADDEPEVPRFRFPWYVQVSVWSFMALWWLFLIMIQLRLPPLPPPRVSLATQPRAGTGTPRAVVPATTQPSIVPPPPKVEAPPPEAEQDALVNFKRSLAGLVAQGDVLKALALAEGELEYEHSDAFTKQISQVRDILRETEGIRQTVYSKIPGEVVALPNGPGKTRDYTIRVLLNERVTAEYFEKMGPATVAYPTNFSLSSIDPSYFIKWVGNDGKPARNALRFGFCMRKGDYESARKSAQCGPLTESLLKIVDVKEQGDKAP